MDVLIGPFVDSTDGNTEETALTISNTDVKLSKNGQTLASKSDVTACAHDANGMYNCELDATDTNTVGNMVLFVHETGSLAVRHEFQVVEEAVYDAMYASSAAGPLQPTTAGRTLDVTATGAAGIDWGNVENTTTAVDLSGTDIQLADTVTTNTDMRGTDSAALASSTGSGLSAIPWNASWDSEVQSEVNDALVAIGLDTVVSTAVTGADITDDSIIAKLVSASATADWDDFNNSTDSLQALRSSLGTLTNVGSAVNKSASSYTLTTGTQSSGTYTDTEQLNGTTHEHTDSAGALELYYEAMIGGGTPSSVQITGRVTSSNDTVDVYGYDWVTASWKQIGTIAGKNGTTNDVYSFDLFVDMAGNGADEGKVRVRFYEASGLTSSTLVIDQLLISFSQGAEGYDNGAVWFNSNAANTGTEVNIDGTARNPVSSHSALMTLLASTGLHKVEVTPGSVLTLGAAMEGYYVNGNGSLLDLGGQDIGGSVFQLFGSVSGTATTTGSPFFFEDCLFATATIPPCTLQQCGFSGTLTQGGAGDYRFVDCYSSVAGNGPAVFTRTGAGTVTCELKRFSGGVTQSGITSADTFTLGGELGTVTLNGADGTVELMGTYKTVTDNRTGSPTLTIDGAILAGDVASILVDTGTTLDTKIDDIQGATFSTGTDSLEAIRNRGDAAWTTGAGGTPPQLLQSTTIATLASQTSFTLTAGSADNDAYNGHLAVVTDSSTSTQKAVGVINDYVGSTRTVTLDSDPGVFTMAATDSIDIVAVNPASSAPTAVQIRQEIDSNSTQLAAIVADVTSILTDTSTTLDTKINTIDSLVDSIKAVTDVLPDSGALTSIATASSLATVDTVVDGIQSDLSNGTDGLGVIKSSVDSLTTTVGTAGAGLTDLGGMSTSMKAEVNTELDDVMSVDTHAEIGTETPAATQSMKKMMQYLYKAWRNKSTETATTYSLFNDDTTTVGQQATVSDDSTTFTVTEKTTG